jgi:hypothetical protein
MAKTKLKALTKKRLLRLADRLDKVKPSHFDIWTWYGVSDKKAVTALTQQGGFNETAELGKITRDRYFGGAEGWKTVKEPRKVLLDEGFCGSVACVLGHAALIPEFNKAGLYVDVTKITRQIEEAKKEEFYTFYSGDGEVVYRDPKVKGAKIKQHFDAGQEFFGLTEEQADMIFGGERSPYFYGTSNPTPKNVAKKLRKFVESNGAYGDEVEAKYLKGN